MVFLWLRFEDYRLGASWGHNAFEVDDAPLRPYGGHAELLMQAITLFPEGD